KLIAWTVGAEQVFRLAVRRRLRRCWQFPTERKPDIVAYNETDPGEERARRTGGSGRRQSGCSSGRSSGPEPQERGREVRARGGRRGASVRQQRRTGRCRRSDLDQPEEFRPVRASPGL